MTDAEADGIRCLLMRGGTSKGAFFLAGDLPEDESARDDLLLRVMGSPDPRQIDGIGGAHPLTSKAAVVCASSAPGIDLDYLFLQVGVEEPVVGTAQTCGNLLAAVGPFALERGLVPAADGPTTVRIRLLNTGDLATATFPTAHGRVRYDGDTAIPGVPGTGARIDLEVAAAPGKDLLPTGNAADTVAGHRATLIDNGMPVVLLDAAEFGVAGDESPADLEERADLAAQIEAVRRAAGPLMGLGDVTELTVPKMILLSPPRSDGAVGTRAFIPSRVHPTLGVLMAASVAAGIRIPGAVGADLARLPADGDVTPLEHPGGILPVQVRVGQGDDGRWRASSLSVRTARKLFDGRVFPRAGQPHPVREDDPPWP